ncbi:MAG: M48 family metallopeptidase [Pseudomonadota bacterium]
MATFTLIFCITLAAGTGLQLWLSWRQGRHVAAHQHQVPQAFAEHITLDQHQKAARYTLAKLVSERWEILLGAGLLLVWTLGGLLQSLDQFWAGITSSALWQGTGLILSVTLIGSLLALPLAIWQTFGTETTFGFNNSTPLQFAKDQALELVLSLVIGLPLILLILSLMTSAGSLWWLWAWFGMMGFMLLINWAFPIWIAPLFNTFKPLQAESLRTRLETLLARCGFASDGIFVMDGSKRSAHGNAYFTGFGKHKRIVFYDTLLDGLSEDQVEAVLAHELGHFKCHHIRKRLVAMALFSLAGLALLGWLADQTWFYTGLGVDQASPALALILFFLMMPVFTIFFSPLMSRSSRKHEFEADQFAAEQTNAQALIDGLVAMYRDNASTLTPDPWYSAFHHSHPPAPVRIAHLQNLAT